MRDFFLMVLIVLSLLILVYLYRVIQGPTVFDRVLGLNGISTCRCFQAIMSPRTPAPASCTLRPATATTITRSA